MKLIINNQKDGSHKCYSELDGDWIIFKCPLCPDYERRMNKITGEIISKGVDEFQLHHGTYIPVGLDSDLYNPN